jgi:HD-like signal output (HDOD) protein
MNSWLIALAVVLAASAGFFVLRRRKLGPDRIAPDSTTQVAALRAIQMPAPIPVATDTDTAVPEAAVPDAAATQALNVRAETLRSLREVAFGIAIPSVGALALPGDEICAQIGATLGSIADKPNYAPRRPMQLPKLMHAINDESASRRAFSQIIAGDPALAGNLLRLANSPFYRHSPDPIESLDRAVDMLGTEGLRSMIAAALLQPVFRISGGGFAHFGEIAWEHSLYAAAAAEGHAALVEDSDAFAAQLLSLIMGLATIVVFSVAQDAFLARQKAPEAAVLSVLIDTYAVSVARQIAASWELSERIDTALAEQLAPPSAPESPLGRSLQFGEFIGALAVLRVRGVIDDAMAQAVLQSAETARGTSERIWARLGVTPH